MSPKRLRKIALYLEYIAFVMRQEADTMESPKPNETTKPRGRPRKKKGPRT
jgi:hypothetical protein